MPSCAGVNIDRMPNPNGTPASLVPQWGNSFALKSSCYSPRLLPQRAEVIADADMQAPHSVPLDRLVGEEIASLLSLIERIDLDLEERGLTTERGQGRCGRYGVVRPQASTFMLLA